MKTEVSDDKKLLTYGQIATMFGVTTRTVKRWRAMGKLKPVTIGQTVRFRPKDIQALIDRGGR